MKINLQERLIRMPKILLITKTLNKGGAASGARNLLGALRAAGAEVIALDGYESLASHPLKAIRFGERVFEHALAGAETHFTRFGPPTFNLARIYAEHRPDIIQLCDVSGNTICFDDISLVPCPVVHRMSDFWPYHGAHHYAVNPPRKPDFADIVLHRLVFDGRSMPHHRVAPSDWLATCLGGADISVIQNAVNTPLHVPPKSLIKGLLRFGFISGQIMDQRKGYASLAPLLSAVSSSFAEKIELHIFGRCANGDLQKIPGIELIHHQPFAASDIFRVYSSFDILLCPSRFDNSPNVMTEALAHGVPVIGQSGTGMESYISHKFGGLIDFHNFNEFLTFDFYRHIQKITGNFCVYSDLAKDYVAQTLSPRVIGFKYIKLYNMLLGHP